MKTLTFPRDSVNLWSCLLLSFSFMSLFVDRTFIKAQTNLATITGQIRDAETGLPIPAEVTVVATTTDLSARLGPRNAQTDHLGTYQITGLAPDEQIVIAKASGYGFERRLVTVGSSKMLENIDFFLEKVGSVSGKVVNENNIPVAGALVKAIYTDDPEKVWRSLILVAELGEVKTSDLGEFVLPAITPYKEFFLEASSDKHLPKFSNQMVLYPRQSVEEVVIRLEKGVSVSGAVTDEFGNPVSGVRVGLKDKADLSMNPFSHSIELAKRRYKRASTDVDGQFVFENVGLGRQLMTMTHAEYHRSDTVIDLSQTDEVDGAIQIRAVMQKRW